VSAVFISPDFWFSSYKFIVSITNRPPIIAPFTDHRRIRNVPTARKYTISFWRRLNAYEALALTLNFPAALIHSPQWVVAVFGVFAAFKVIAARQMQRASFQSFNIVGALGQKNGVMASFHKLSRGKHPIQAWLS